MKIGTLMSRTLVSRNGGTIEGPWFSIYLGDNLWYGKFGFHTEKLEDIEYERLNELRWRWKNYAWTRFDFFE